MHESHACPDPDLGTRVLQYPRFPEDLHGVSPQASRGGLYTFASSPFAPSEYRFTGLRATRYVRVSLQLMRALRETLRCFLEGYDLGFGGQAFILLRGNNYHSG